MKFYEKICIFATNESNNCNNYYMKRLFIIALGTLMGVTGVSAQYFSTTKGCELIYKSTNLKDKSETQMKSTVLSVDKADNGVIKARNEDMQADPSNPLIEIKTYREYSYDPATEVSTLTLMTADDFKDFVMSMIRQSAEAAGQHFSEMELADLANTISSKGVLELPLDPKAAPDTKLPKSTLRLSAGMMTMRANLWEGKILGTENVEVPAGTYDCLKVSYQMVMSGPDGNDKRFITEWYAKDLGLVKSQETDKKGNVKSEDVLVGIRQ